MKIHDDAKKIMDMALKAALPDTAVEKALKELPKVNGRLLLIAIGKAAWQMAAAAHKNLGERISGGIVITKHDHSMGPIGNLLIREAGHPVPDEDTYSATLEAIEMVSELSADDMVIFLISGGGSALFEKPLVPVEEMDEITHALLACGADIVEMNTLRKRLSAVKGGKFAALCSPAKVFSVVLSDILGDPLDMIASGPAYPDSATSFDAKAIVKKYGLKLSSKAQALLDEETPKALSNAQSLITGSVRQLCETAKSTCIELGYEPVVLTDSLSCEAKEAGSFMGAIAQTHANSDKSMAFIAGGETIVHLTGTGMGGRNQEFALSGAKKLCGIEDVVLFSLGSDGTDGPTDAAGGIVDGTTAKKLSAMGISIDDVLKENDAYNALKKVDGLIMTGPTGTNVNDLSVLLIKR